MECTEEQELRKLSEKIKDFWNESAGSYGLATEVQFKDYNIVLSEISYLLPELKPCKILDVGTGTGFVAVSLSKAGHDVTGIDFSEMMIEHARKLGKRSECDAKYLVADVTDLPFEDNSFDVVVMKDVLFNLPETNMAFNEVTRVLKNNGYLVIMDGNYYLDTLQSYVTRAKMFEDKYGKNQFQFNYRLNNLDFEKLKSLVSPLEVNKARRPQWDMWNLAGRGYSVHLIHSPRDDEDTFPIDCGNGSKNPPISYTYIARLTSKEMKDDSAKHGSEVPATIEPVTQEELSLIGSLDNRERLLIVHALMNGPMTVSQLSSITSMAQNNTSYNLGILRNAGIVKADKHGRESLYSLSNPVAISRLCKVLGVTASHMKGLEDDE